MPESGSSSFRRPRGPLLLGAVLAAILTFGLGAWAFGLGRGDDGPKIDTYYDQPIPPCKPRPGLVRTPSSPAPAEGAWRKEPDSPMARDEAASALLDGKVYLLGGHKLLNSGKNPWERWSTPRVIVFDPETGRYSSGPDLPIPIDHAGAAEYRGRIYVVGGWSNGRSSNKFFSLSPKTGKWSELPALPLARGALQAQVIGDKLYAIGGAQPTLPNPDQDPYDRVDVFDFKTRQWSRAAGMPTPRHHFGAAVLDGKLYVAGGRQPTNYHITQFERFDPAKNAWDNLPRLPQGISAPVMVSDNDEVLVIAGADERAHFVTPAVWAFKPATNRWRRLPDLEVARHAGVGAVTNGRVYVFEGSPCPGYGGTTSVESLPVPVG